MNRNFSTYVYLGSIKIKQITVNDSVKSILIKEYYSSMPLHALALRIKIYWYVRKNQKKIMV